MCFQCHLKESIEFLLQTVLTSVWRWFHRRGFCLETGLSFKALFLNSSSVFPSSTQVFLDDLKQQQQLHCEKPLVSGASPVGPSESCWCINEAVLFCKRKTCFLKSTSSVRCTTVWCDPHHFKAQLHQKARFCRRNNHRTTQVPNRYTNSLSLPGFHYDLSRFLYRHQCVLPSFHSLFAIRIFAPIYLWIKERKTEYAWGQLILRLLSIMPQIHFCALTLKVFTRKSFL